MANPLTVVAGEFGRHFYMFRATGANIYLSRGSQTGRTELMGYIVNTLPSPIPTLYIGRVR